MYVRLNGQVNHPKIKREAFYFFFKAVNCIISFKLVLNSVYVSFSFPIVPIIFWQTITCFTILHQGCALRKKLYVYCTCTNTGCAH